MKIVTVFFDRDGRYSRLLAVFKASAKAKMPNVDVVVLEVKPSVVPGKNGKPLHKADCTVAFCVAAEYVLKSEESVAVCDVDMYFRKSIEDVWDYDFDVAYTTREYFLPLNTGIWFARPTERARAFVRAWEAKTKALMDAFMLGKASEVVTRDGGVDQASLRAAIRSNRGAKLLALPCLEWNATQSEWAQVNGKTRIVHVKSALRHVALEGSMRKGKKMPAGVAELAKEWQSWAE